MTPQERRNYIVACLKDSAAMYEADANAFLDEFAADLQAARSRLASGQIATSPGHEPHETSDANRDGDLSDELLGSLLRTAGWDPTESMVLASWNDADRLWGELMERPAFQEHFGDTLLWPIDTDDSHEALITVDLGSLRLASLCQDGRWMIEKLNAPALEVLRDLVSRVQQVRTGLITSLAGAAAARQ